MNVKKGVFVAFEGGDGCGKTTQIKLLKTWLEDKCYKVLVTREPGGGIPELRQKLFDLKTDSDDPAEIAKLETALFIEDRTFHFRKTINPAIERGEIVLCDRDGDSTVAYQGYGRALETDIEKLFKAHPNFSNKKLISLQQSHHKKNEANRARLREMNKIATGGRVADLTIFLDMNPEDALPRIRGSMESNRLDKETLEFHKKVADGYRKEILRDMELKIKNWQVVWADDTEENVFKNIVLAVEKLGL